MMGSSEVRRLRISAGLTQQDLADLMGVTQVTVARWESGVRAITVAHERLMRMIVQQRSPE